MTTTTHPVRKERLPRFARSVFVALACFTTVLLLQLFLGAYTNERGVYSDEAAHFLNGLLIRDYVYDAPFQNPITFAIDYYQHYPKAALGVWPPFFHVTLALFLLPGWPPGIAAIVLVGMFSAWAAWRLHQMVDALEGPLAAAAITALFLVTPAIASLSGVVMLDMALAATAIEAAYWLARYFETGERRHAALFGLMAALCCLTKANGVLIVLAPAFMILLTGQWRRLLQPGLYIAAAIVVVLAVPPLLITTRLGEVVIETGPVTAEVILGRLTFYSTHFWSQLGPLLLLFAAAGIAHTVRPAPPTFPSLLARALAALAGATLLFHLVLPHRLVDERYMAPALGPLLGLAAVGVGTLVRTVARQGNWPIVRAVLLGILIVSAAMFRPALQRQRALGYRAAVDVLANQGHIGGGRLLIISNEQGEGAFVSEVAVRRARPMPQVIRGSKMLASDNWMGSRLELELPEKAAVIQELEDLHVDFVVVDRSPAMREVLPYWQRITEVTDGYPRRIERVYMGETDPVHGPIRAIAIYRVKRRSPGPAKQLFIDLSRYGW